MSIVYTDNLKLAAKRYGPNSNEVMEELANLDEVLQVRKGIFASYFLKIRYISGPPV